MKLRDTGIITLSTKEIVISAIDLIKSAKNMTVEKSLEIVKKILDESFLDECAEVIKNPDLIMMRKVALNIIVNMVLKNRGIL